MEYEIVVTLGPASELPAIWEALLAAGATGFRLNTSHLSLPQLHGWLERITPFLAGRESPPPLILDLQGSKWRLGEFTAFTLAEGEPVDLLRADSTSRSNTLPVPHADFFEAAAVSSREIALNDARIILAVESADAESMRARVIRGGEIAARKGITYAASEYRQERLSAKDRAIVEQTQSLTFVQYAVSYVRDAVEMARYRERLGPAASLIAKLERRPAVDEAAEIAKSADALWLCRGDLGAELGIRAMAEAVARFSEQVPTLPVPAWLAGQVLEHMTGQLNPTRSEVCYLYEALCRGYRGVVLSDETAIGRYPVESCRAAALFRA